MSKLAGIAILGFSTFIAAVASLHFLEPEYALSSRFISEYALGRFAWVLHIGLAGNLVGSIAFLFAVHLAQLRTSRSRAELFLFGVTTASILTNFLPADIHGKAVTVSGHIHNWGAFQGSITALVFFVLHSMRLNRTGLLTGIYRALPYLAILASVLFVSMLVIAAVYPGVVGILQRVYSAVVIAWLILAANGMRSGATLGNRQDAERKGADSV